MNKKRIIAIIVVAIVGTLIFWKRDLIKRKLGLVKDTPPDGSSNDYSPAPVTPGITYKECTSYPMTIGCKGKHVVTLQKVLNKLHGSGLKEDGYFGPKTETALEANGYGKTVEKEDIAMMKEALTQ